MQLEEKLVLAASSAASVALGWLLPYTQIHAMTFVSGISPVPRLLKSAGLDGSDLAWALYPFDFLTLVLASLPIAIAVSLLRPRHLRLYTALAVIPFFVTLNAILFRDGTLTLSNATIQQWITSLLVLPAAVLLVNLVARWGGPNNSFKPNPLRGSA